MAPAIVIDSDSDSSGIEMVSAAAPSKRKASSSPDQAKPAKKKAAPPKASSSKPAATKKKKRDESSEEYSDDDEQEVKKPKKKKQAVEKKEPGEKKVPIWLQPRAGPSNPGSKEIPEGEPDCLSGKTFVFTGELESLSREEAQELVKRYGGRVTSAPSGKTSFVVIGTGAGASKLKKIEEKKLRTIDEDQFIALIGGVEPAAPAVDKSDKKAVKEAKEREEKQKKNEEAARKRKAAEEEKARQEAKEMEKKAKKEDPAKAAHADATQLWTVKYAPTTTKEICGNKGQVEKLQKWLQFWPTAARSEFKKPGPDGMGIFRAVLIYGPPGIGKTTSAHLIAKLEGYNVLELNASDTRSKKLLEAGMRSTIENTTLSGFFDTPTAGSDGITVHTKNLIIMDEVDGMSAGDRGGVGALNALIKKTKVPIIAICNDAKSPKMKPLQATTAQIMFKRPSAIEMRSRLMTISFKEKLKLQSGALEQLVAGSGSDIRQVINMLSTWKLGQSGMTFDEGKEMAEANQKNSVETPWTLFDKLTGPYSFSATSKMSVNDKMEVYFNDFSMMPLFVQQNYLRKDNFARVSGLFGPEKELKTLELIGQAADAISEGDLVDRMIHGDQQQWSLMPVHAVASCVRPAYFTYGTGGGFAEFPKWLGMNSSAGKMGRGLGDIQIRMRLKVSGDRKEIRQQYIPALFNKLVKPLQERGTEAIADVIRDMDEYYLTKEDWEMLVELGIGKHAGEPALKAIAPATKSAFTRNYNKASHPIPFYKATDGGGKLSMKKLAADVPDNEDVLLDEVEEEEDEVKADDDQDPDKDKMIKKKAAPKKKASKKE